MQLFKSLISGLVALCLLGTAQAQISPGQVMPTDPQVKIGTLSNGLTYYIRKNSLPEKRVEMRLVVNAGSILEDDDQLGLAHFMEHMNFNGTTHFPKNELVSYLQSIGVQFGADLNAYTSFDETVYILPVPTDKPGLVDKGLQILQDWAHNATLDSMEIEKERGVVIEEWRLGRGADERMMKQTLPVQYQGSKYANHLPIGNKESLEHFSPGALRRFYHDWYRPDLEAVVIVGDIDVDEMEQKVKSVFGAIPPPASERPRIIYPVPDHKDLLSVVAKDKETDVPFIEVMFKKDTLPETTVGDYNRYINQSLFTGMLNSRFRERALNPNPPFISAGSGYGGTFARSKDAFRLLANSSDTGMAKSLYALLEEGRRVKLYGFTPTELERQKKQLLAFYEREFNEREKRESFNLVDEYVNNFLEHEPIPGIEWEYDYIRQYLSTVNLDDINKLAAEWITPDNNMVVTFNASDKTGVQIPSPDDIKAVINAVETASIAPYKEKILASTLLDPAQLKPGHIVSSKSDDELGTTTVKLSNGATVILKPTNFKNDEILVRAFSKGGHSLVSDNDYYSAINAAQIVQQSGVGDFTAADLSNMLKGRNTNLVMTISQSSESMSGSTTPKELETFFQLAHLYFTKPRKDAEAFESYKTKQKQLYENLAKNPQIFYSAAFQKIMTSNHPRAAALPTPEDFDKINLDRAIDIYKERFDNAGDFTFLVTGSFTNDQIKPLLERYIGSLPTTGKKENFKDLGIRPPTGKVEATVNKGTEPQSLVNIVFTAPAKYSQQDLYDLHSLGELLTIKLTETLREEKSEVYGVSAFGGMQRVPYSFYTFNISFPCAPENADTLTDAALGELKKIMQSGVSAEDLEKIKEQQRRKLEVDTKQNAFWMSNLFDAYYNDYDPHLILDKEKQIDGLTAKRLQGIAKKYIDINTYIRVVLKPEQTSQSPMKAF